MKRESAIEHLHPRLRGPIHEVLTQLHEEEIPFRLFEGFRSPARQAWLYAQGRTREGGIVTNAPAWSSYHQYGLAGDFVLYEDGKWSWDTRGGKAAWWKRLQALGKKAGLHYLSWEKPHLELAGLKMSALREGEYPDGGDEDWASNLSEAIATWTGLPPAPPAPMVVSDRPTLPKSAQVAVADVPVSEPPPVAPVATVATVTTVLPEPRLRYRIIARSGLRLRGGPGTEFDVIGSLSAGSIVTRVSQHGDWLSVDLAGDGLADGFCHGGFLQAVV